MMSLLIDVGHAMSLSVISVDKKTPQIRFFQNVTVQVTQQKLIGG